LLSPFVTSKSPASLSSNQAKFKVFFVSLRSLNFESKVPPQALFDARAKRQSLFADFFVLH